MAKATEGTSYTDKYFAANWKGMGKHLKVRGAYHFGHPAESATSQVSHFLGTVGSANLRAGDFLVLDIESATAGTAANTTGLDANQIAQWSLDFVSAVRSKTKRPVFVYTGEWFWDPHAGGSAKCEDYPLWVSGYSSSPPMPKGWSKWTFWQ
jgi:GH25 family lysozyme M1 (1,4-beta-N-acetylmuramidase)